MSAVWCVWCRDENRWASPRRIWIHLIVWSCFFHYSACDNRTLWLNHIYGKREPESFPSWVKLSLRIGIVIFWNVGSYRQDVLPLPRRIRCFWIYSIVWNGTLHSLARCQWWVCIRSTIFLGRCGPHKRREGRRLLYQRKRSWTGESLLFSFWNYWPLLVPRLYCLCFFWTSMGCVRNIVWFTFLGSDRCANVDEHDFEDQEHIMLFLLLLLLLRPERLYAFARSCQRKWMLFWFTQKKNVMSTLFPSGNSFCFMPPCQSHEGSPTFMMCANSIWLPSARHLAVLSYARFWSREKVVAQLR